MVLNLAGAIGLRVASMFTVNTKGCFPAMATKKDILIGIDLGTSSTKVVAFDLKGKALASAGREHEVSTPKPNWAEQDPEDWWAAACASLKDLTKKIDPARVAGISFSGQMHGSVFLDAAGKSIRPTMLWCDGRTARECDEIVETVGRKKFLSITKNLPLTSFTLPKILWLAKHEKANYRKLATVLLPKDYVRYRLTDVKSLDTADGAGTVMMEVGAKRWAPQILETLGLNPAILPPLTESCAVVGSVTEAAAKATGLKAGTPVVAGGGDQPVGATGTGVFSEGQVMLSLGTSGVVFAPTRKAHVGGENGLASFDHAVPGVSYLMGCVIMAAGSLQWFRNTLCDAEMAEARKKKINIYDMLLERAFATPLGAEDLLFLPYLMGERTPHNDPDSRAVFFGLSTRHTKAHMTRAVIEGINFAMRDCLELVKAKGVKIREARVIGGGARNRLWLQNLADILNLPVSPVQNPEGAALGAAILAGVGTGVYKSFEDASRQAIQVGKAVRPNAKNVKAYEPLYQRFRALYPAVKDHFVKH